MGRKSFQAKKAVYRLQEIGLLRLEAARKDREMTLKSSSYTWYAIRGL